MALPPGRSEALQSATEPRAQGGSGGQCSHIHILYLYAQLSPCTHVISVHCSAPQVAYVSRIMSKNFRKEGQPEKERIARITGMDIDKVRLSINIYW